MELDKHELFFKKIFLATRSLLHSTLELLGDRDFTKLSGPSTVPAWLSNWVCNRRLACSRTPGSARGRQTAGDSGEEDRHPRAQAAENLSSVNRAPSSPLTRCVLSLWSSFLTNVLEDQKPRPSLGDT